MESIRVPAGTRFVPKAEERLLAVVHALLHRCYKMPFSNNAEVPASLKKELSGEQSPSLLLKHLPPSSAVLPLSLGVTESCSCRSVIGGLHGTLFSSST